MFSDHTDDAETTAIAYELSRRNRTFSTSTLTNNDSLSTTTTTSSGGDSFMFIIGHIGAVKQETHISCSANPAEAVRQYNNGLRGTRPGIVCVCIYVPGWRRLAVQALVLLWHRSRKLYCRMRFGIMMAYNLSLPCYVSPLALHGEEARKSMPHIVARLVNDPDASRLLIGADELRQSLARKRGRRPSAYDAAVAESIVFGDLSTDGIATTIQTSLVYRAAMTRPVDVTYDSGGSGGGGGGGGDDDQLDQLNTLTYQHKPICFTVGKHGHVSKRTSSSTSTTRSARRHRSSAADDDDEQLNATRDNSDDVDEGDDEEAGENDEDSSSIATALVGTKSRQQQRRAPTTRKVKRKKVEPDEEIVDLAPIRQRNLLELDQYTTSSSSRLSTTHATGGIVSTSTNAGANAARDCMIDGVFDNRLLLEQADSCYTDAREYRDRPMTSVRLDRAQLCVCGARNSFTTAGVCGACHRSSDAIRVVRTNLVALREQATKRKCGPHERRELRHLLLGAERDTPIDAYTRTTTQQLREVLAQQQLSLPTATHSSTHTLSSSSTNTRARVPKEMGIITAALSRFYERKK